MIFYATEQWLYLLFSTKLSLLLSRADTMSVVDLWFEGHIFADTLKTPLRNTYVFKTCPPNPFRRMRSCYDMNYSVNTNVVSLQM